MGRRLVVVDIGRNLLRIYEYVPTVKVKQTPSKTSSQSINLTCLHEFICPNPIYSVCWNHDSTFRICWMSSPPFSNIKRDGRE
jgi:hypothetical protein